MMASGDQSYRWMDTLLTVLFARYDRPGALALLQDLATREQAMADLAPELVAAGMRLGLLATPEGQNLFVAVLSLRLKFSEAEAREKVALNIAMREGRA